MRGSHDLSAGSTKDGVKPTQRAANKKSGDFQYEHKGKKWQKYKIDGQVKEEGMDPWRGGRVLN